MPVTKFDLVLDWQVLQLRKASEPKIKVEHP